MPRSLFKIRHFSFTIPKTFSIFERPSRTASEKALSGVCGKVFWMGVSSTGEGSYPPSARRISIGNYYDIFLYCLSILHDEKSKNELETMKNGTLLLSYENGYFQFSLLLINV